MFDLPAGLGPWSVRNSLLGQINRSNFIMPESLDRKACKDREISGLIAKRKATGAWPMGPRAQKAEDDLRSLPEDYLFALAGRQRRTDTIDLLIDTPCVREADSKVLQLRVRGNLDRFENEFLHQSASRAKADKVLDFYIRLALGCADDSFQIDSAKAIFMNNYKSGMAKNFKLHDEVLPLAVEETAMRHAAGYHGLLTTLAGLYLDYRECGLPFLPELSFELPADRERRAEAIEQHWFGDDYGYRAGIKDDMPQRAFFGAPSALNTEHFFGTAWKIGNSMRAWLKAGDGHETG
jgi:hypothetical protein